MKKTETELTAIFFLRTKRDNWGLVELEGPGDERHYNFLPPVGHPWRTAACQWLHIVLSGKVIFIPSYAFDDDPVAPKDVSMHEIAKVNLDEKYAFIGGELDQKICSVGNPIKLISYNGENYRQLKAGKVTFYAHQSMGERQAIFLYYMATDNGVGPAKFSRN